MSCRIGRHGQQKGGSTARIHRETELGNRGFIRHGKKMTTRPRFARYEDHSNDRSKYFGEVLRALRGLRGVGRPIKFDMEFKRYG
jgi:hypothetical protein